MASKLSFLNSLMERKKPKDETNELAMVKAAAWAWHQHNSCSEGKVNSEFHVTRAHHASRPSRYKLEAMSMDNEAKVGGSPIHKKESLLDAYEVQSISRVLNGFIESNNNKIVNGSVDASVDIGGRRMRNNKKKKEKIKKIRKGFWIGHGAVCGKEEDVADHRALRDGHRQSAKHVPVVNMVKCLPISKGAM